MRVFFLLSFFCINFLFQSCWTLKCRAGNQQVDDRFTKVMQICRRRNSNGKNEDYSDNSDSDESDSDEDIFDKKFYSGMNRRNNNTLNSSTSNNRRYDLKQKTQNRSHQSSFKENNMQSRRNYESSNSDSERYGYERNSRNSRNNSQNNNYNNQQNKDDNQSEQECMIQCFFNELNVVDHRGFPERNLITGIMTENIHDPQLRDFVEESIIECFHYLRYDMKQNKCRFSQNLVSCLADKGRERCDDWND